MPGCSLWTAVPASWWAAEMRIESVTAAGFGPLARQTLQLAPGLTVVCGDNESGKSSWHAATFAALCGRRRGRGRPTAPELRFVEAHEPWDGGPWVVGCHLTLDDGRLIELRQDLAGKVDCRATDVALARDVSAEIMVDGSPDASAWLGLGRAAFQATACVGQAEVLRVLDAADGLQHALQRATSTASTSGTAAVAISELEAFRRSAVGRDTAAAIRPLRKARESVALAETQLASAYEAQEALSELAAEQARLDGEVASAFVAAESAVAEVAQSAEALRAAERRSFQQEWPSPSLPRHRVVARSSNRWWMAAAAPSVALLIAAAVLGSTELAGLGVVLGVVAGLLAFGTGGTRLSAGWPPSADAVEVSRDRREPARDEEAGEMAELRMEWAERQALAERARRRHHEAALRAGRADAVRGERSSAYPCTAEAEEALAAARRELVRVEELDETLALAIDFLSRAQERVHREVTPELTAVLRSWLPRLTGGRYVDARMDPATLEVEVGGRDGEFRSARLLSHGTAEQVYLLLRVALAAQLTVGHDTCPLLLDDVTVHADLTRSRELLELLHELSRERQIVLFAHQQHVREWASQRLDGERDRLVCLDAVRV